MDFRDHRPNRRLGRSERPLVKIATDLTSFLTKAQRSLTYETLHLSGRQRETLAHILVEFAEKTCIRILASGGVLKRTIATSLRHHSLACFSQAKRWTPTP
jgi:hypothetical protein